MQIYFALAGWCVAGAFAAPVLSAWRCLHGHRAFGLVALVAGTLLVAAAQASAADAHAPALQVLSKAGAAVRLPGSAPTESWSDFQASCAADVLACGTQQAQTGSPLPSLPFEPPTDQRYASLFPSDWPQLQYNQAHDPVFGVPAGAPSFLSPGTAWAAPLTGDEFLRLARGLARYGSNGGEAWGPRPPSGLAT